MKFLLLFSILLWPLHADSVCVVNGIQANGATVSPSMEIYCEPSNLGNIFGVTVLPSGATQQIDIPTQPNLGPYIFDGELFASTASLFRNGISVTQVNGLNVFCPKYVCDQLFLAALDRNL